jgi:hypothetical protein
MSKFQLLFQALLQTEQNVLPIFIHNPASQKIVGAVLVAEEIFGQMFGLTTGATGAIGGHTTTTTTTAG